MAERHDLCGGGMDRGNDDGRNGKNENSQARTSHDPLQSFSKIASIGAE
jgi:hypothetical protein